MSELALKVESVSKMYRLGQVGTGTLSHDLNRWWAKLTGKEDPLSKVGMVNDREKAGGEYVWALNDVNLEVNKGEIVGVIGKNGAGKSTLLKILSRVTGPTKGRVFYNGKIASLLEVGTGFHPELTGRENIYLNGALLGMTKKEITSRFDEIVEFSGCAKYVDTPVKRYSSGMNVRLGFAVAAHLNCDILIVDEVLAVGDAEFQNKCIGKMQDISEGQGRTVLVVSHSMNTIRQLCDKA
ncbi:MAG: ABC transporter ATP-binding protein, partial [Gammaproteobacteria bacterium]|nr:ABC transporter ATP-binding protein [Gammaproteobacteria bacterium]